MNTNDTNNTNENNMNMRKIILNNNGTVLLITLLILTSILTVALGTASLIVPGIIMNRTQLGSTVAFYAAEAGAERALWEARKSPNPLPDVDTDNLFTNPDLGNSASYDVDYAISSPIVTFTCNGIFQGARRSVQLVF